MKKVYDNYDYEEAYQKQIDTLEEWEIERIVKDGKVDCLYRTTTIKSKIIKAERKYWNPWYIHPLKIDRICQGQKRKGKQNRPRKT